MSMYGSFTDSRALRARVPGQVSVWDGGPNVNEHVWQLYGQQSITCPSTWTSEWVMRGQWACVGVDIALAWSLCGSCPLEGLSRLGIFD